MARADSTPHRFRHDGRVLRVEVAGAPHGTPVFLMHGSPGSRSGPRPRSSVLYRLGVRLVCYDRPGYGGSTRHKGRTVADTAADVAAIADKLGVEGFAVVGRSAGGPHALACAALLPDRVKRTAVLVGFAPADADGLDWYDGMIKSNVDDYAIAETDPSLLEDRLASRANGTRGNPENLLEALREEMPESDRRVIDDVALRRLLTAAHREALRAGHYGWFDDVCAQRGYWGFRLEDIKGPVRLWHGEDDTFSPASHTRFLASRIPDVEDMTIQSGAAHFGAMEVLPRMLPWLIEWDETRWGGSASAPAATDVRMGAGR